MNDKKYIGILYGLGEGFDQNHGLGYKNGNKKIGNVQNIHMQSISDSNAEIATDYT